MASNKRPARLVEILGVLRQYHAAAGLSPQKLREILEALGPTFVKLGQVLSMRPDMLPESYCEELQKLQTDVEPMAFDTVCDVLSQALGQPAGVLGALDPVPIGSASIAQVHLTTLPSGEKAVVKVQRPHIAATMEADISILRRFSGVIQTAMGIGGLVDLRSVVDDLWETSQREMDFRLEAEHLALFRSNMQTVRYVTCPQVFPAYTSETVLVMSYVDGVPIDDTAALENLGYDPTEIATKTAETYCKQILDDGFFHADPHPGNLLVSAGKIAWIDFGMTGTVSSKVQRAFEQAIQAVLEDDIRTLTDAFLEISEPQGPVDRAALTARLDTLVHKYLSQDFGSFEMTPLITEMLAVFKENRLKMPADLALLSRSMITMEGTIGKISPKVNLAEILANHMRTKRRSSQGLQAELLDTARLAYAASKKSLQAVSGMADLVQLAKRGQFSVGAQVSETDAAARRRDRRVNRCILAALVVCFFLSGAVLCLSEITPAILGLPWPAAVCGLLGLLSLAALLRLLLFKK